jgi:pilus assembly protein CpaE
MAAGDYTFEIANGVEIESCGLFRRGTRASRRGTRVATAPMMLVTFLGTKGGTGTTTLAVNAAALLRQATARSTVIVDLADGPGDVALFLGLRPKQTLLDMIDHRCWMDPAGARRLVTEHTCGLHVVASGEEFGRPSAKDAEGVDQLLRHLTGGYDYAIVDSGSRLTTSAAASLPLSDLVVLVANPDVPCLRNLQRLIDAVRLAGVPSDRLRIVLNRASEFGVLSTPQIERVLGLTIDFAVGSDYRTVAAALNSGVPVSALRPSELLSQMATLARALANHTAAA